MLFDTHCHLTSSPLKEEVAAVLKRSVEAGVTGWLSVATDLATSQETLAQAKAHPGLLAAVGIHPEAAGEAPAGWEAQLEALIRDGRPSAVGECGLDAHHPVPAMEVQLPVFQAQIRLAKAYSLPIVIHSRKTGFECLKEIEAAGGLPAGGVFHCIEGDEILARAIVSAGFHLGIGGIATYPRNEVLRGMLARMPLDRILLETDAPWLPPQPLRGKTNEPAFMKMTAATVAAALGTSVEELGVLTTANARRLFGGAA